MVGCGVLGDPQLGSDVAVAAAPRDQAQDVDLPRCQASGSPPWGCRGLRISLICPLSAASPRPRPVFPRIAATCPRGSADDRPARSGSQRGEPETPSARFWNQGPLEQPLGRLVVAQHRVQRGKIGVRGAEERRTKFPPANGCVPLNGTSSGRRRRAASASRSATAASTRKTRTALHCPHQICPPGETSGLSSRRL